MNPTRKGPTDFEAMNFRDFNLSRNLLIRLAHAGMDCIGLYVDRKNKTFKRSQRDLRLYSRFTKTETLELGAFLHEHGYLLL